MLWDIGSLGALEPWSLGAWEMGEAQSLTRHTAKHGQVKGQQRSPRAKNFRERRENGEDLVSGAYSCSSWPQHVPGYLVADSQCCAGRGLFE
jgi:hypothetical protein